MKKFFNVIKTIFVWLVVLLAVAMMIFTVVSCTTFNRNDRSILGYKMYIVNSDSMAATDFNAGSLIFVKEVDPSTLQEGDIITYMSQDTNHFGETITHKIRTITTDAEGNPGFITYGTTTDTDDETIVTYPYVMGKYVYNIPSVGTFFNFLKTTQGYFICIFAPFMLIIIFEGIRFFSIFRRYKKEQMEEMQSERDKIEEERAENARMLREIQLLKAQLEATPAPVSTQPKPVYKPAPVEIELEEEPEPVIVSSLRLEAERFTPVTKYEPVVAHEPKPEPVITPEPTKSVTDPSDPNFDLDAFLAELQSGSSN